LAGRSWVRLLHDVYVHHDVPLTHRTWCEAAILVAPPGSAIAATSAAALWGALDPPSVDVVTLLVPATTSPRRGTHLRTRRAAIPAEDVTTDLGLPVTTPLRAAFDIARYESQVDAVIALDTMLRKKKIFLNALLAYVDAHPGLPRIAAARLAVALVDPKSESPMETRLRLLLIAAGLPAPITQYKLMATARDGRPRFVARLDFAYPEYRLALEYDGDHHRDRVTHRFDMERQNDLHVLGWTVLRFHADDVLCRPEQIVAKVHAVLRKAGWRP